MKRQGDVEGGSGFCQRVLPVGPKQEKGNEEGNSAVVGQRRTKKT